MCEQWNLHYDAHLLALTTFIKGTLVAWVVKCLPTMRETRVQYLGWEDLLEKEMQPLQYSCLENPMDRGAWWATVHGVERVGQD